MVPDSRFLKILLVVIGIVFFSLTGIIATLPVARAISFTVNSTLDTPDSILDGNCDDGAGNCTLRAAISEVNNSPGPHTIIFDISGGGPHTIALLSALPPISQTVTIDGTSQPGFSGSPLIELDGSAAGVNSNGLTLAGGNSTVRGLVINNFPGHGLELNTLGGNTIVGNYIGTDVNGATAAANGLNGIYLNGVANNIIGGTTPAGRNVISGNSQNGVYISGPNAANNTIRGNFIGTNAAGTAGLGNSGDGLVVNNAPQNTVNGNLISGNGQRGIFIWNSNATGNIVQGNTIGPDINGTTALGNGWSGVVINNAPNNLLGGQAAGTGNLIAGNGENGVYLLFNGAGSNTVQGNIIGLDVSGTTALGNAQHGLYIQNAPDNTIGGSTPAARNVISGNSGHGILLAFGGATGNRIEGNFIGTNTAGTAGLGNREQGIALNDAPGNTIGGTAAGTGNVISGNWENGVYILGVTSAGNTVQGNTIGLNAAGLAPLPNRQNGVYIFAAPDNFIGPGNLISGNRQHGVLIAGATATGNQLQNNRIGSTAGSGPAGNTRDGVRLSAGHNTVGGVDTGANTITGNGGQGVTIESGTGNAILGNTIVDNAGLGIDLAGDGVTANDPDDPDTEANNRQNFPLLSQAQSDESGRLIVAGSLNSLADTGFRLEFFTNDACDPSMHGEGQTYVGSLAVTTAGNNATFAATLAATVPLGQFITTTATDPANNTSEFSECLVVSPLPPPDNNGDDDDDDDDPPPTPTPPPPPQAQNFDCWPWLVIVPPLAVPHADTLCRPSLGAELPAAAPNAYLGHSTNITLADAAGVPVTTFNPPLQICFRYRQPELDAVGGDPARFLIQTWRNNTWQALPTTPQVDPSPAVLGRVCAPADHLTLFALFDQRPNSPALLANEVPATSQRTSLDDVMFLPETGY